MKTLKDAIEIILAEPPEMHYPAYYADLLREADVPDMNIGKCSEIPNSSETIYRQAAIDALRDKFKRTPTNAIRAMDAVKQLPSTQPEIVRCGQCKYAEVADSEDGQDGYTCQFHRGSIWFSGSYCSWAERRTDEI